MIDMETLKFDEKGLIPAIVVDGTSGQVLTLAYMNKESLEISIRKSAPVSGAAPARSSGARARRPATPSTSSTSPPTATTTPWWSA